MDRPDFVVVSTDQSMAAYDAAGRRVDLPEGVVRAWSAQPGVQVVAIQPEEPQVAHCVAANDLYRQSLVGGR